MRAYSVTATDAVTLLVDSDNKNRTVYLNIVGNETVAIGGASVTYATGLSVAKGAVPLAIFLPTGEKIYGICNTTKSDDVRVLTPDAD